ncbi:hypothetical protein Aab01nite_77040 [Paractinoplanes abujensis]|uniref:NADPH-dependent reductive aminase-like C-terminal domain-containing protein n=1 Tax=Paractinoplanes abujensis TaxID=882441 RepID=A0A7W7G198_9ACTN|nr:hypothetical protein [Actinoplanes abujensis]MBB4692409.1 hypothetical protein [Actinoplanes abujensis]GID24114.1 hypothetical protein Aab01nite_77040 [Actinoplanes abujensis]
MGTRRRAGQKVTVWNRSPGKDPHGIGYLDGAYDIALLDIFWTAMAGYAHALAVARAEGITARELAPFAAGIGAILPPIFRDTAGEVDDGTFSGAGNPITSAASPMAHHHPAHSGSGAMSAPTTRRVAYSGSHAMSRSTTRRSPSIFTASGPIRP